MSVCNETKQCFYLQQTKQWFQEQFKRTLNEEIWNKFQFAAAIKDERFFFSSAIIAISQENDIEPFADGCNIYIHVHAGNLYNFLSSSITSEESVHVTPINTLAGQFSATYQGNVHKKLLHKINWCYRQWTTKTIWHSPYLSIVQSSGCGKSRACKEIATTSNVWHTVFICCRNSQWEGYPPRTTPAVHFFENLLTLRSDEAENQIIRWIKLIKFVRLAFRQLFLSGEMDMGVIASKIRDKEFVLLSNTLNAEQEHFDDERENAERTAFWSFWFDKSNADHFWCIFNFINGNAHSQGKYHIPDMFDKHQFLLVVDEARFLCEKKFKVSEYSLFRVFRSALQNFDCGLFVVLVDTQSQIANFPPSHERNPSFRLTINSVNIGKDLFHPFTAVTTTDLLCDKGANLNLPEHRFTLGRPLWKTTFETCQSVNTLLNFALDKLFCGNSMQNSDRLQKENGIIACMAVLTGMNISPASTIAKELVASHMATCLAIDFNRESLAVTYPVEPVLAEAAKGYVTTMYKNNKINEVLQPLLKCFRIGVIDWGQNGELVAKLLFLFGLFTVSSRGELMSSLHVFLVGVFGAVVDVKDFGFLLEYEISFNCFTEVVGEAEYWKISNAQKELELFFNRGAAIQLPKCHVGADLLFPIRRTHESEIGAISYSYKYLLVQVKNCLDKYNIDDCIKKLKVTFEPSSSWASCNIGFAVIMNTGQMEEVAYWVDEACTYLVVNGLGSTVYPEKYPLEAFRKMLRGPSITDWIVDPGEEYSVQEQRNDVHFLSHLSLRPSIVVDDTESITNLKTSTTSNKKQKANVSLPPASLR